MTCREEEKNAPGKDLNFIERKQKFILSTHDYEWFIRRVKNDSDFLQKCNINDYSLLVGIHELPAPSLKKGVTRSVTRALNANE